MEDDLQWWGRQRKRCVLGGFPAPRARNLPGPRTSSRVVKLGLKYGCECTAIAGHSQNMYKRDGHTFNYTKVQAWH